MYIVQNPNMLLVSMLGVGLAWASILSMPYAILAGALPKENVGVYMGIFNFFIVIPQDCGGGIAGIFACGIFWQTKPFTQLCLEEAPCCWRQSWFCLLAI